MNISEIEVVEYSVSQECYHVHSLRELLETNNESVYHGASCDYLPIGFFKNYEEASNFVEWHRSKMSNRITEPSTERRNDDEEDYESW